MINKIKALISCLTPFICFVGMLILVGAVAEKLINAMTFLGGIGVLATTAYIAVWQTEKHWDGKEWK